MNVDRSRLLKPDFDFKPNPLRREIGTDIIEESILDSAKQKQEIEYSPVQLKQKPGFREHEQNFNI